MDSTITGLVATSPRHIITSKGLAITSFRLAAPRTGNTQDKEASQETNWFTITSFRQLALNAAASINKGDRVIITGDLRIRDWDSGERNGTTVEIEAKTIGHDMNYGNSSFNRIFLTPTEEEQETTD